MGVCQCLYKIYMDVYINVEEELICIDRLSKVGSLIVACENMN